MKAMMLERFGEAPSFALRDIERPEPRPGEVLIKVAGSSFNPIDNKIAALGGKLGFAPALPAVPGLDVSGVVEDIPHSMSRFQPGDRVFGCAGGVADMPGALAEYMVADERLLAPAPKCMDLAEAAALPLVSITAWLALFERANLKPCRTLLVHGGAGGVGHLAVQLAQHAGAKVFATVSNEDKAAVVESMGATPIPYREVSVADYVAEHTGGEGFDVVFDTVGGKCLDQSFEAAALGGQVVSTSTRSSHDLSAMHAKGLTLHVVFMLLPLVTGDGRPLYGRILHEIAGMVDDDDLAVLLDGARFDYTEVAEAHRYWASGQAMGKILLTVGG
ncbi:zinc-binding dehydrogenase [Pseudodesulfovibrio sp.]|uniref:zinc-binding dehydrogenase n=1 Tax=Pseudodesulfovibrio sp. TaxID=2035812 RepID=UPI00261A960D|nr:zinc-binding dehydrogenase [Pseudodesulfovibrio sp.]MDD3311175.1 zinc-binding dehydrogenase [Pseudodesulfovibrio sp.]